jgi:hypothetical protein
MKRPSFWRAFHQLGELRQLMLDVNQLKQDMASLKVQVAADQAAVAAVQAFVGAQAKQIADLTAQLAAAQAANPDVDLSDLEASIAGLVATNQVLGSIAPGAPVNSVNLNPSTGANPGLTSTGAPAPTAEAPGTPAADASGTAAQTSDESEKAANGTGANQAPAAPPQTAQSEPTV